MAGAYVALLRGVNNVGSRRVAMADLRALFERLGFLDVHTILNSGNVLFSPATKSRAEPAGRIEKALASTLALRCRVTVLCAADVAMAVRGNPLSRVAKDPSRLLVLAAPARADLTRLKPLLKQPWAPEVLALGRRVAYLWCADGVGKSRLWPAADRALQGSGTARNMATMTKVLAAMEAEHARK